MGRTVWWTSEDLEDLFFFLEVEFGLGTRRLRPESEGLLSYIGLVYTTRDFSGCHCGCRVEDDIGRTTRER